jgi:hypothetical protein
MVAEVANSFPMCFIRGLEDQNVCNIFKTRARTDLFPRRMKPHHTVLPSYSVSAEGIVSNNSVAWVCERTKPTERQRLVGEVRANFCG